MIDFITGWKNFLIGLDANAKEKAKHCEKCPFNKLGKIEIIKEDDIKEINGRVCSLCSCPLSAKLRSKSKCKLGKF